MDKNMGIGKNNQIKDSEDLKQNILIPHEFVSLVQTSFEFIYYYFYFHFRDGFRIYQHDTSSYNFIHL
jgi:hypothetical protein